jgi:hypothetical protein
MEISKFKARREQSREKTCEFDLSAMCGFAQPWSSIGDEISFRGQEPDIALGQG